jgi:hypothetical protein
MRSASIGAAVVASISAARAQQLDGPLAGPLKRSRPTPPLPHLHRTAQPTIKAVLQGVNVTATKQAENIQSIPVTVTAVTQAALEN